MIMTPYEISPPKLLRFGRNHHKKLPEKIKNDAAADDSGSFAYERPKLLGFGK
jgi:hypothetical protein